ncbi:hypothetical protein [Streptomyces sp. NPDC093990]|uniref:hypothetical protein n=1 Tax=Streptomyces sp. NPDC093990 TaxID=3155306 RepID=UPI00343EE403
MASRDRRRRRRPLLHIAVAVPLFGVLEAAGPEELPFADLAADGLAAQDHVTPVLGDAQAPFGPRSSATPPLSRPCLEEGLT